jgi:hypothetical protein
VSRKQEERTKTAAAEQERLALEQKAQEETLRMEAEKQRIELEENLRLAEEARIAAELYARQVTENAEKALAEISANKAEDQRMKDTESRKKFDQQEVKKQKLKHYINEGVETLTGNPPSPTVLGQDGSGGGPPTSSPNRL